MPVVEYSGVRDGQDSHYSKKVKHQPAEHFQ